MHRIPSAQTAFRLRVQATPRACLTSRRSSPRKTTHFPAKQRQSQPLFPDSDDQQQPIIFAAANSRPGRGLTHLMSSLKFP
jgi:hypothetical protein